MYGFRSFAVIHLIAVILIILGFVFFSVFEFDLFDEDLWETYRIEEVLH